MKPARPSRPQAAAARAESSPVCPHPSSPETQLNHPNILKLFEVDDEPKKVFLVMELVTGGELFDRVIAKEKYTEREAADTIVTLCSALNHLHSQKPPIVHRDLKPENILYGSPADDAPIKLADFGLARFVEPGAMMTTACGTPGYVAPEILKNEGYDSPAVDMWSVGVVLYILLCGFPPFYEEELPKLFEQIMHAQYDFPSPWWDMITAEGKQLVQELLVIDPTKRLTAEQVIRAYSFCMRRAASRSLVVILTGPITPTDGLLTTLTHHISAGDCAPLYEESDRSSPTRCTEDAQKVPGQSQAAQGGAWHHRTASARGGTGRAAQGGGWQVNVVRALNRDQTVMLGRHERRPSLEQVGTVLQRRPGKAAKMLCNPTLHSRRRMSLAHCPH